MSRSSKLEEAFERLTRKIKVLTHYGKGGELLCRWPRCTVCNPDHLSLDHVNGCTKVDRQPSGRRRAGSTLYKWVEARKFPKGFQTLCFNHQAEKELKLRRRKG